MWIRLKKMENADQQDVIKVAEDPSSPKQDRVNNALVYGRFMSLPEPCFMDFLLGEQLDLCYNHYSPQTSSYVHASHHI